MPYYHSVVTALSAIGNHYQIDIASGSTPLMKHLNRSYSNTVSHNLYAHMDDLEPVL